MTRILRSAPAESERTPHPRRADRRPRRGRCRRPRAAARGPATRPRDRAPARRAVGPAAGPAHAVGGDREPAPGPRHRVDRPPRDRRRPVARRGFGLDPCLCDPAPRRPAGGRAPRRARDADRADARADRGRAAGAARAPPCRADAAGGAASAVPGPLRPVVPAARARADRGGVRRQSVLRARDRPLARGVAGGPDAGRAARHPGDAQRAHRGADRRASDGHRAALLLAAVAIEPTLETLRRADPDAPAALPPAIAAGIVSVDRRIDPVRASAAGPGRDADGEPGGAAGRPRGPRPNRDVRRRASPPPRRRHRGSRRDRRRGARGGRGQRPSTRRDARRRIALRTGEPAHAGGARRRRDPARDARGGVPVRRRLGDRPGRRDPRAARSPRRRTGPRGRWR